MRSHEVRSGAFYFCSATPPASSFPLRHCELPYSMPTPDGRGVEYNRGPRVSRSQHSTTVSCYCFARRLTDGDDTSAGSDGHRGFLSSRCPNLSRPASQLAAFHSLTVQALRVRPLARDTHTHSHMHADNSLLLAIVVPHNRPMYVTLG